VQRLKDEGQLVRRNTAPGIRDERVPGAFFFDGEKGFVGFGGAGAVESFARAALVIVNGGQNVIAGNVVEKDGSGFAAALEANVEFRGSFGEGSGVKVGAAHVEMAQPGVSKFLRFLERI